MEPVDDGTGLQVELGGQLLDGLGGGVGLLLVGPLQSLLLLGPQHYPGLLQVLLLVVVVVVLLLLLGTPWALGALQEVRPHGPAHVHRVGVTQGAQTPLHVGWNTEQPPTSLGSH